MPSQGKVKTRKYLAAERAVESSVKEEDDRRLLLEGLDREYAIAFREGGYLAAERVAESYVLALSFGYLEVELLFEQIFELV